MDLIAPTVYTSFQQYTPQKSSKTDLDVHKKATKLTTQKGAFKSAHVEKLAQLIS